MSSRMLMAARLYSQRFGIPILPVSPQKKALIESWPERASVDVAQLTAWFTRWPEANIAGVTGSRSRIVILDVDIKGGKAGMESLSELEKEHGELPVTPTALTPSKGLHFYFRHEGPPIRRRIGFREGLDLLGENSFAVLPPSIGADGGQYHWEVSARIDEIPFAPLPAWLAGLGGEDRAVSIPASEWIGLVATGVSEGQRNQSLTRLVGHLLRRYVDPYLVLEVAKIVNEVRFRPPLSQEEVTSIVDSVSRIELASRQKRPSRQERGV